MMRNVPGIGQSSITYFPPFSFFFKTYFISVSCPLFLFFSSILFYLSHFSFFFLCFFFFYLITILGDSLYRNYIFVTPHWKNTLYMKDLSFYPHRCCYCCYAGRDLSQGITLRQAAKRCYASNQLSFVSHQLSCLTPT
jgi:hypothetical protein